MGLNGKDLASYSISMIGVPYFYGSKMKVLTESYMQQMKNSYPTIVNSNYLVKARNKNQVGKVNTDCSGLIGAYRGKQIGSSQLYSTAYKRLPISQIKDFAIGTVLWKSGHVGVYIGMENGIPMCVEAKGIDYGTVKTRVSDTKWTYGLTFQEMEYTYDIHVDGTSKATNPYTEPTVTVRKGAKGNDVKWIQFELVEAGYNIAIDGDFGTLTYNAVKSFQYSCKIEEDGIVGKITRSNMKIK